MIFFFLIDLRRHCFEKIDLRGQGFCGKTSLGKTVFKPRPFSNQDRFQTKTGENKAAFMARLGRTRLFSLEHLRGQDSIL